MKRFITAAALAVLSTIAVVAGGSLGAPATHADPANVLMFNPSICLALMGGANNAAVGSCGQPVSLEGFNGQSHTQLLTVEGVVGNNNGVLEASDFQGLDTFTGHQIHQLDDGSGTQGLLVVVFVNSNTPVHFHTSEGTWGATGTQDYNCQGTAAGAPGNIWDPDCGGDPTITNPPHDHVVTAWLQCTAATCPTLGDFTITVEQDGVIFPVTATVVGEARTVSFFTLEKAIQAGMPVSGTLNAASALAACPFSASLPFIQKALGEAEKTVIVARAYDVAGTAISGAWFNWTVDNATNSPATNFDSQGILSQPTTPTLNLGAFGYGAPNILCAPAGAVAGKVTVRATFVRSLSGLGLDPNADPGDPPNALAFGETSFDVVGAPASVNLAADPATVSCDGTNASTVSATLTDAAGNAAISGTAVTFSSPILATANPINAVTNDNGVATSKITPLSGTTTGVPVTVSVQVGGVTQPNLTQQILVNCTPGVPGGASGPGGTGGGTPAGGTGGQGPATGITGPNTGTGPGANSAVPAWWWALALVGVATCGLGVAGVFARKRVR